MKQTLIGVDIGIWKNTGIAIYFPKEKQYHSIRSTDVFEALQWIQAWVEMPEYNVIVIVENSDLDSNVFGADQDLVAYIKKWQTGRRDYKLLLKQIRKAIAWGSNVGKNKGIAVSFLKKLNELNIPTVEIAPSQRRKADKTVKIGKIEQAIPVNQLPMPTKTTAAQFQKLTGYRERTNEHGRDAATLVWKKTFNFYQNFARTQKMNRARKKKK